MVATGLGKRVEETWLAVEVHSPDLAVPPDLAAYAREKLTAKLAKFRRSVLAVVVRLKDVNGSKRGVDKSCHLEAGLARLGPVNVEQRHEDLRAAIDLAIAELAEAIHRHTERERTRRRNRGRKIVRHVKLV